MPALLLNYFGQGAFLLSGQQVINSNLFFSLYPNWALIPMVVLATLATIIASQALITGAFSLTTQAINLKLLPFTKTIHTHEHHEGQIYVPFVNWALYVGCISLVIVFKSSSNMAAAYGLAVSLVMFITTLVMIEVTIDKWNWSKIKALSLFVPLALIDLSFLLSNSVKFFVGGYVPLMIALSLYVIMKSWNWGEKHTEHALRDLGTLTIKNLVDIKKTAKHFVDKSVVFMSSENILDENSTVSTLEQVYWERVGMLPKHILLLHISRLKVPHATQKEYQVKKFFEDDKKGSITLVKYKYGFMEEPRINEILVRLAKHKEINIDIHPSQWSVHVLKPNIQLERRLSPKEYIKHKLYRFIANNATTQDQFWDLDAAANLTIQSIPVRIL
ncbi:KUP/HAK/KT family potassium transporter [Candidatus Woesebacteria bacterium]|nr:MAG: KUP/HAK/KT family potassium transporter [Candidatus Woesebacteria bacterium]